METRRNNGTGNNDGMQQSKVNDENGLGERREPSKFPRDMTWRKRMSGLKRYTNRLAEARDRDNYSKFGLKDSLAPMGQAHNIRQLKIWEGDQRVRLKLKTSTWKSSAWQ